MAIEQIIEKEIKENLSENLTKEEENLIKPVSKYLAQKNNLTKINPNGGALDKNDPLEKAGREMAKHLKTLIKKTKNDTLIKSTTMKKINDLLQKDKIKDIKINNNDYKINNIEIRKNYYRIETKDEVTTLRLIGSILKAIKIDDSDANKKFKKRFNEKVRILPTHKNILTINTRSGGALTTGTIKIGKKDTEYDLILNSDGSLNISNYDKNVNLTFNNNEMINSLVKSLVKNLPN